MKKFVTSTSALIGRSPIDTNRSASHFGEDPLRTSRNVRPRIQGQAARICRSQRSGLAKPAGTAGADHGRSVPTPAAARSRATPRTDSASPRLGVTPISITGSSSPAQVA